MEESRNCTQRVSKVINQLIIVMRVMERLGIERMSRSARRPLSSSFGCFKGLCIVETAKEREKSFVLIIVQKL